MRAPRTLRLRFHSAGRVDQRLLEELRLEAPSLSRARLKEAFREGKILLEGRAIPPSLELSAGAHELGIRDWDPQAASRPEALPAPEGCFLPIIHEDESLLVLDKASGIPSLPHAPEETRTAVGAALARCPDLRGVGRGPLEPGLLHRLDTGTSGLLAFAKSAAEHERLSRGWKSGGIRKVYRALAPEVPRSGLPWTLRPTLGHDARSTKRMVIADAMGMPGSRHPAGIRGKALPTLTRILRVDPVRGREELADFEIEIETGVMHQIRCTLASIGAPILGDAIYGGEASERLWLHAWKLVLPRPSGEPLSLEAPLPRGWPQA